MYAKVSRKGQLTIPAEVRKRLNIGQGSYVRFIIEDENVRLVPVEKGIEALQGRVAVSGPQNLKAARHLAVEENARERTTRNRR